MRKGVCEIQPWVTLVSVSINMALNSADLLYIKSICGHQDKSCCVMILNMNKQKYRIKNVITTQFILYRLYNIVLLFSHSINELLMISSKKNLITKTYTTQVISEARKSTEQGFVYLNSMINTNKLYQVTLIRKCIIR